MQRNTYGEPTVVIYETIAPNFKAKLALDLMTRFGLMTADGGGEDTAGRQKFNLLPPAVVVERACEMAEVAWAEFERRGWLLEIPDLATLKKVND